MRPPHGLPLSHQSGGPFYDLGKQAGILIGCRREMAGDAGVALLDEGASPDVRHRAHSQARIDFEIRRDPERPDNQIAKACRTSTLAIRKARVRLGIQPSE